ncbi:MAG: RNA methyltransferase [Lentisphaerae bacterium]|nr:RNA methyltransferase [Lentisphaerota bacterium]
MSLDNVRVVLVKPIYGGNVGAVCRAMANMGLSDLALVAPRPLDEDESRMMACHARGILEARREFPDLPSALADCAMVTGTSARGGLYRRHARTPREWAPAAAAAARAGRVALVFGPEDNGLTNEDLAVCTHIVRIPAAEDYTSLNVAQAALVCCYELFLEAGSYEPPEEKSPPATTDLRERMFDIWRRALLDIGFMKEDMADHMMLGLRRVLSRGALTVDDVNIMMGVARQAEWAARREGRG